VRFAGLLTGGETVKSTTDLKTIELQLDNRLISTSAEVRFDWDSITVVLYLPEQANPAQAMPHEFTFALAGSRVQLVERSPLGSKPVVRTLYDFAQEVTPG